MFHSDMTGLNHLEVNFQRLLAKCEELAEKQDALNWRYEKVII